MNEQMGAIRLNLQAIESQIVAGKVAPESIGDFKSAVDDVRLRVWAIMAAQNMPDGPNALKRFRIRRTIDLLQSVTEDLAEPKAKIPGKDLALLAEAGQRLMDQIAKSRTT